MQVFSYLSAQLFNFLMLNEEFCTFDCAEYLGAGLSELEGWVHKAGGQWAGHCLDQLHHIRQVAHAQPCWPGSTAASSVHVTSDACCRDGIVIHG